MLHLAFPRLTLGDHLRERRRGCWTGTPEPDRLSIGINGPVGLNVPCIKGHKSSGTHRLRSKAVFQPKGVVQDGFFTVSALSPNMPLRVRAQIKPTFVTCALDPEGSGPDTHYKVLQAVSAALSLYREKHPEEASRLSLPPRPRSPAQLTRCCIPSVGRQAKEGPGDEECGAICTNFRAP